MTDTAAPAVLTTRLASEDRLPFEWPALVEASPRPVREIESSSRELFVGACLLRMCALRLQSSGVLLCMHEYAAMRCVVFGQWILLVV